MLDKKELKHFVENNGRLLVVKRSERYPGLRTIKYHNRVFYDNLWNSNPLLKEYRGLVVDDDYNVVVKPFTKVFNYQENGTVIHRDEPCQIVRKVNGFMAAITNTEKYGVLVSTTGSLDSKFVDMTKEVLGDNLKRISKLDYNTTWIFEICHPDDPHIIDEQYGSYLIGANDLRYNLSATPWELLLLYSQLGLGDFAPEYRDVDRFSDILHIVKCAEHEGFMVRGQLSGTVLKLKSPYYLVTKLFARMNTDKINKVLNGDIEPHIDEDFKLVIDFLRINSDKFLLMNEQDKVKFVRTFIEREILK